MASDWRDETVSDDATATCVRHLQALGRALNNYEGHRGELPPHLSDLYPVYATDLALFHCPADPSPGDPLFPELADPRLPTSYIYEQTTDRVPPHLGWHLGPDWFEGLTWRDVRSIQCRYYGDRVPVLYCRHHQPSSLHLDSAAQVYQTQSHWELDPATVDVMLERMEQALSEDPTQFATHWLRPDIEGYFSSISLEVPLPATRRRRMSRIAARLCAAAELLPDCSPSDFYRLAARLYYAAGRTQSAVRAYRQAARQARDDKAGLLARTAPSRPRGRGLPESLVEAYLQAEMARQHIPGLSVAVLREGQTVLAEGYGLANVELSSPATAETVYRLASVTKPFTGIGIMLLVEERSLSLDDRITEILPDLPMAWGGITVRHLLTHTSGIKDYPNAPGRPGITEHTPEACLGRVADLPLEFDPGERHAYSNSGYVLLGLIIEKHSEKTYGEFLAERIFQPLGMATTGVVDQRRIVRNRASGYVWEEDTLWNHPSNTPQGATAATGGLLSTVLDLAKWDAALSGETLLKRETIEQMWTPATLNDGSTTGYGLGWSVGTFHNHRRVGHTGRMNGFSPCIRRFTDGGLTVIVLCNLDRIGVAEALANEITGLYLKSASVGSGGAT
jgi:CubicO group peptidase (beta-lactamase class C family)